MENLTLYWESYRLTQTAGLDLLGAMMVRLWWVAGSVLAGLGVAAGAFGAHALKARLTPELLSVFETGVRYQMYHALGLLAVAIATERCPQVSFNVTGWLFLTGILLFSGSLYVLCLTGVRMLGAITPIGGICFLAGWALLGWKFWASKSF
jgi:uncharacterized membrane protein YgdD (TMEM256/DUF423 family)